MRGAALNARRKTASGFLSNRLVEGDVQAAAALASGEQLQDQGLAGPAWMTMFAPDRNAAGGIRLLGGRGREPLRRRRGKRGSRHHAILDVRNRGVWLPTVTTIHAGANLCHRAKIAEVKKRARERMGAVDCAKTLTNYAM
jgi:hypothetical protein